MWSEYVLPNSLLAHHSARRTAQAPTSYTQHQLAPARTLAERFIAAQHLAYPAQRASRFAAMPKFSRYVLFVVSGAPPAGSELSRHTRLGGRGASRRFPSSLGVLLRAQLGGCFVQAALCRGRSLLFAAKCTAWFDLLSGCPALCGSACRTMCLPPPLPATLSASLLTAGRSGTW